LRNRAPGAKSGVETAALPPQKNGARGACDSKWPLGGRAERAGPRWISGWSVCLNNFASVTLSENCTTVFGFGSGSREKFVRVHLLGACGAPALGDLPGGTRGAHRADARDFFRGVCYKASRRLWAVGTGVFPPLWGTAFSPLVSGSGRKRPKHAVGLDPVLSSR